MSTEQQTSSADARGASTELDTIYDMMGFVANAKDLSEAKSDRYISVLARCAEIIKDQVDASIDVPRIDHVLSEMNRQAYLALHETKEF